MARILAISGSPSHPSRTYSLIEHAIGLLPSGIEAEVIAVRDLPPEVLVFARFDSPALDGPKALLEQADGLIVATPIYKAAYTGLLKSFWTCCRKKPSWAKPYCPSPPAVRSPICSPSTTPSNQCCPNWERATC